MVRFSQADLVAHQKRQLIRESKSPCFYFVVSSKTPGKCVKLNLHELRGEACCCHCHMTEACHVDELISAWQREAAHHFPQDRIIAPDVADKSLEEVEIVLG